MSRPTIVLADDDAVFLEHLQKLLDPEFQVVAAVGDGQALLAAAHEHQPNLIIADISMPLLNGIQAARRLKETEPDAKILFLTKHEDPAFLAAARKIGVVGYVVKRSISSQLVPSIRGILRGEPFDFSNSLE